MRSSRNNSFIHKPHCDQIYILQESLFCGSVGSRSRSDQHFQRENLWQKSSRLQHVCGFCSQNVACQKPRNYFNCFPVIPSLIGKKEWVDTLYIKQFCPKRQDFFMRGDNKTNKKTPTFSYFCGTRGIGDKPEISLLTPLPRRRLRCQVRESCWVTFICCLSSYIFVVESIKQIQNSFTVSQYSDYFLVSLDFLGEPDLDLTSGNFWQERWRIQNMPTCLELWVSLVK